MILRLVALFIISLGVVSNAMAQDEADTTKLWDAGMQSSLTFSQVSLNNWAGGGDNSIALNGFINSYANRKKGRSLWENTLNLAYGLTKIGEESLRKSDDKIEFITKYGYALSEKSDKFSFSSSFTFRSQFANGFEFPNDSVRISKFLAPGYMLISIGIDYKPVDYFTIFYSPVTSKITLVNDDDLAARGAFGVDPGSKSRFEMGSFLKFSFKKDIFTNVNLDSRLDFFSNYTENPDEIDVNWETALIMKINKIMSANLLIHMIYDKDVQFDIIEDDVVVGTEDRVQLKQVFGVGLTFTL